MIPVIKITRDIEKRMRQDIIDADDVFSQYNKSGFFGKWNKPDASHDFIYFLDGPRKNVCYFEIKELLSMIGKTKIFAVRHSIFERYM